MTDSREFQHLAESFGSLAKLHEAQIRQLVDKLLRVQTPLGLETVLNELRDAAVEHRIANGLSKVALGFSKMAKAKGK